MLPVDALSDLAGKALAAVVDHWPAEATPLPADVQYVSAGTAVWDCESVVVMANSTLGTDSDVALEQIVQMGMGYALRAADLSVLILRCVPVEDDSGNPPTADQIQAADDVILVDSIAVMNALMEAQAAGELATCNGLAFLRWSAQAASGGLGGGLSEFRALLL